MYSASTALHKISIAMRAATLTKWEEFQDALQTYGSPPAYAIMKTN